MRTISDQCAFREVVPGVGAFPSKVLSSCSLRSSVNMILLLSRLSVCRNTCAVNGKKGVGGGKRRPLVAIDQWMVLRQALHRERWLPRSDPGSRFLLGPKRRSPEGPGLSIATAVRSCVDPAWRFERRDRWGEA